MRIFYLIGEEQKEENQIRYCNEKEYGKGSDPVRQKTERQALQSRSEGFEDDQKQGAEQSQTLAKPYQIEQDTKARGIHVEKQQSSRDKETTVSEQNQPEDCLTVGFQDLLKGNPYGQEQKYKADELPDRVEQKEYSTNFHELFR